MDLYLMRHGEALTKAEAKVGTDTQRPLSSAGIEVVRGVAQRMKSLIAGHVDLILSSSLIRAMQTAQLMGRALGCDDRIEVCRMLLPDADPEQLLDRLRGLNQQAVVLAVGHQPLLGRIATQLALGAAVDSFNFKPAGIAWLELPEFPRTLDALLRGFWNPEIVLRED